MSDRVAKALAAMAVIFDKRMTAEAVDLMLVDLSAYSAEEILSALALCRKEIGRFPTTADILKRIPSNTKNPSEVVGKILLAVELYGYPSPEKARQFMGEIAWRAVNYFGGWKSVCDYPGDSAMALRAQLRNSVLDAIERNSIEGEEFYLKSSEWRGGNLEAIDFKKLITGNN